MIDNEKLDLLAENTNVLRDYYKMLGYDISREVLILLAIEITYKKLGYNYKEVREMLIYSLKHKDEFEEGKILENEEVAAMCGIREDRIIHTFKLLNLLEPDEDLNWFLSEFARECDFGACDDKSYFWKLDVVDYIIENIDEIPEEFFNNYKN